MLTALRKAVNPALRQGAVAQQTRAMSAYAGQVLKDGDLVKKKDDWAIEETNFCLGRLLGSGFRLQS